MEGNKYHSTIKIEFRDLINNLVNSERKSFHVYTIHRILSLGVLIDFTFRYIKMEESDKYIGIKLDLDEHGEVLFVIEVESNYGKLADKHQLDKLENFLCTFDTRLKKTSKKKRIF